MKTFVLLAVSIVSVSILFCPMAIAAPPMPDDLQIVQPDPSLPKELSVFFGKWEGSAERYDWFVIVGKIDEEKARLYVWRNTDFPPGGACAMPRGWIRPEALVTKQGGKYKLSFRDTCGIYDLTVKGKYLDIYNLSNISSPQLRRVP
ncbi:MAG TPA: hypothetical protein VEK32_13485 [Thermodesulfobacteriota bacterium]|nr:hypothetical protein [Thermodesulfobacteriota bacterium]